MVKTRRAFFLQAAAVSTLPAFSGVARAARSAGAIPALHARPVEVDVADAGAAGYFAVRSIDAYARLEAADPGDPGELSGCTIRIFETRDGACVSAEMDAIQRDGATRLSHCLGCIDDSGELLSLIESEASGDVVRLPLRELEPGPARLNGVRIELDGGGNTGELRVCCGSHVFGVLRGSALAAFLNCLQVRCAQA
jgi:hypothetical protein